MSDGVSETGKGLDQLSFHCHILEWNFMEPENSEFRIGFPDLMKVYSQCMSMEHISLNN